MFIGEYQHAVDDKGRLAIPIKFRNDLAKGAVVTKGLDDCLFLYSKEEWEKQAEKMAKLPFSKSNSRSFSRLMFAGAMEVEIDKQGRVVLPDYLRKFADISKKVVVAGLYDRIEIWDEEIWDKYKQGAEKSAVDIAEKLEELDV